MDLNHRDVGDLLLETGSITPSQLEQAKVLQRRKNLPQHRAILELNLSPEDTTYRALAKIHGMEYADLASLEINRSTIDLVPSKLVFHYRMVPISIEGETLTLAFGELPRQLEQGNLRLLLGKQIRIVLATPSSIQSLLRKHFGLGAETVQKLRDDRAQPESGEELVFDVKGTDEGAAVDATISDFVDQILVEALRLKATDIHLEPYNNSIRLRYRIDGLMQSVPVPSGLRQLYGSIASRLKIMAGLNIAEKRLPQDGRISMKRQGSEYDLRVSTIPTKFGEALCLRVLGRQSLFLDLGQLGMDTAQENLFLQLTRLPQGLILLTGPTGSGKTTTLYAAIGHANDEGRKIITIEDPVEYQLEGTTQIQVREDIGLTFATGLRSVLRHDPDVVLIGEIRDAETAEIAVRAAQTGHLVFSTLHTNDSVSTLTRLLEMKIDPFLVTSSLVCSIAQRLARRICRHCNEPDPDVAPSILNEMAISLGIPMNEVSPQRGRGCAECGHKAYRGRVALYEFFLINDELCDLIGPNLRTGKIREAARKGGWKSLREEAWKKVQSGLIPVSEVERLTRQVTVS